MKKIRVEVVYEMEIPDEWEVIPTSLDNDLTFDTLIIDEISYEPGLSWWELEVEHEDISTWKEASKRMLDEFDDNVKYVVKNKIVEIEEFKLEKNDSK
jgi:hypothetical protein